MKEGEGFGATSCPGPNCTKTATAPRTRRCRSKQAPARTVCYEYWYKHHAIVPDARLMHIRRALSMGVAQPAPSVELVESWNYIDMQGDLLVTVHRRDHAGRKYIRRSPKGAKPPPGGWPLYQLTSLVADTKKPILVVEGERTVDRALHLFGDRFVVTTALGGAGKARQTDWSPCRGRIVNISAKQQLTDAGWCVSITAAT